MRKPGIILLTGEPDPCAAVRAALEALGLRWWCEVWCCPDASLELEQAVLEHGGERWECFGPEWDDLEDRQADPDSYPCFIDVYAVLGEHDCRKQPLSLHGDTWGEVVADSLGEAVAS